MNEQAAQQDREAESPPPARPVWVKILIGAGAGLVLLMLALHLTGHAPIGHGVGSHVAVTPSGGQGRP